MFVLVLVLVVAVGVCCIRWHLLSRHEVVSKHASLMVSPWLVWCVGTSIHEYRCIYHLLI